MTHDTPHGRIVTDYWPKPIPIRSGDWSATTENYDGPGSPIGCGSTEQEAIDELIAQLEDRQ